MENYNMTVKKALIFIEGVEKLKKTNPKGLKEISDYMELQIFKGDLIESIKRCYNLKSLKALNGVLKRLMKDETDKKHQWKKFKK